MARGAAYAFLATACLVTAPLPPAIAQSGPGLGHAGGLRPFAEPLFWLNDGPPDRLPLHERPLARRPGLAGAAPPRDRREGLIPSLSAAAVYRRGDQTDPRSESFGALSFGVDYTRIARNWQILADYSVETTDAKASGSGIDSRGGFLSFAYQQAPVTRLGFFLSDISTEDLLEINPVQALSGGATRFDSTSVQGTWTQDLDPARGFELGLSVQRQATRAAGTSDTHALGGDLRGWAFLSPTGRLDARARLTRFELEPQGARSGIDRTHAALRLGYTADMGPRMAASGHVGVLDTSGDGGRQHLAVGGEIERSWRFARLGLDIDRSVIAVPGLDDLVLTDQATARIEMRVARGVLAEVTLEQQRLEPLEAGSATTHVTALEGQLSWALKNEFWVWNRLRISRETSGGADRDDARLIFGISRNLDF